MSAGFVYILINASMPGVVKVGKTERDPEGRAKELSGVTGVPTPFLVVYQEFFDDCSAAEAFVHTLLEAKGFRVATNREFFSAPAQAAIQAIIQAKTALGGKGDCLQPPTAGASTESSGNPQSQPWEGMLASAEAARYGFGDTIQDLAEAARLYEKAAKLGSGEACYLLGELHRMGNLPGANDPEALKWLNEGVRRGYAPCYSGLASFYLFKIQLPNAGKCWAKYREACAAHEDDEYWREAFYYLLKAEALKVTAPDMASFWRDREKILRWGEQHANATQLKRIAAIFARIIDRELPLERPNAEEMNPSVSRVNAICSVPVDESPIVQRLLQDRPTSWEHSLTVELLKPRISELSKSLYEACSGQRLRRGQVLSLKEYLQWSESNLRDLTRIMRSMTSACEEGLVSAWGAPGEPGDAEEIKQAVEEFAGAGQALVEWAAERAAVIPPDILEKAHNLSNSWAKEVFLSFRSIAAEIETLTGIPGDHEIVLRVRPPDFGPVDEEMARALGEF